MFGFCTVHGKLIEILKLIISAQTLTLQKIFYKTQSHHTPKQDPIRSMQHVLVDLQYEKAYIFNNLIKCSFCNFTHLMPPTLDARGCRPVRPLYTPLSHCIHLDS